MHQSISLTDWQKSGGAKDYNALPEAGCIALADEGVTRTACSTRIGVGWCIALADEGVTRTACTQHFQSGSWCIALADEGVTQASRTSAPFPNYCVSLADERMM